MHDKNVQGGKKVLFFCSMMYYFNDRWSGGVVPAWERITEKAPA